LRFPYFLNSWLKNSGEVVSLMCLPPFILHEDSWYSFVLEAESTPGWLERLGKLKNPMTSLGIEPATFYNSCINVLSLLLTISGGHFLLYSVHRKGCTKYVSYTAMGHQIPATENAVLTSGAAHLEEL
jgi:hypothetical protein